MARGSGSDSGHVYR